MLTRPRHIGRGVGVLAAAATLTALSAPAALAHVTVSPSSTAAGASAIVTLAVSHGCDGSPTTKLEISIPEGVNSVAPTATAGWTVNKVTTKLDPPVTDAHGSTLTERVSEVVYTADEPLAEGYRAAFELSLRIPEDRVGQALAFPTVQTCQNGETAWIELPEDGQSEDDLEEPAPSFTVTAAAADPEAGAAGEQGTTAAEAQDANAPGTGVVSWVALALGALGAALGAVSLARSRRG